MLKKKDMYNATPGHKPDETQRGVIDGHSLGKKAGYRYGLLRSANCSFVTDSQLVTSPGATACKNIASVLCFHTLTEPVYFCPFAIVGLKCAFWHGRLLVRMEFQ